MKLNALVMSRSHSSVRTLVAAFAELGIEYQVSPSASETMETLATGYHSALIVDFDLPHAIQVIKMARMASGKRRPVLFGMVGAGKSIGDVFQAGANFVLYKPLDLQQVLHSLRATQGFMREDRRGSSRKKSESLAYLQLSSGNTAALVQDLTRRGLLQETLVVVGSEFGRTPVLDIGSFRALANGRDHNPYGYTTLLAGGGVKAGMTYGSTDDFGFKAAENPVHVHDLHATMLHLLGLNHEKLTYRYSGRDFRLTDVAGSVVKEILA